MKKIALAIIGAAFFVATVADKNLLNELSDWSYAQAVGYNITKLIFLIGGPYLVYLGFKRNPKNKSGADEKSMKEANGIDFKRYFPYTVIIVLVLLLGFILLNDDKERNQGIVENGGQSLLVSDVQENDFIKKVSCSELKPKIEIELGEEANRTGSNVILHKIFFSEERNSCLFAYVIEDDYSNRQCNLNAETVHYDSLIIKDYLSNQTILNKTKGCGDYWFDSFERDISLLEGNVESSTNTVNKYGVEVLQIGGVGSRITQKTAYLLTEHGYLKPPEDWVSSSFNGPADIMDVSCRDDYIITSCVVNDRGTTVDEFFGCRAMPLENKMQNSVRIECSKK